MGHGGTNFAHWAGANGGGGKSYEPHETSYDYDSPISEAGEHGYHAGVDKFAAMQSTLAAARSGGARIGVRVRDAPPPAEPALPPRAAFGKVVLTEVSCLLCTVTFYANLAHSPTRSPNIFDGIEERRALLRAGCAEPRRCDRPER